MTPQPILARTSVDAVILDLDGVVTDTAALHEAAWRQTFDEVLRMRAGDAYVPFTSDDYRRYVDGRPRLEGVRTFLQARGIDLPLGPADDRTLASVHGIASHKAQRFLCLLEEHGVPLIATSIHCIRLWRRLGYRTAVVSASRNAPSILARAGLEELFDVQVDGNVAAELRLRGKPEPDTFLHAARLLGVAPARAAVVEDALAGVRAGKSGQFAAVIALARGSAAEQALAREADLVVRDLTDIPVAELATSAPAAELPQADALALPSHPLILLDYDGTLTPIVERPEQALLSGEARRRLAELARLCPVAIVSGRDLATLRRMVGLDGLAYAGSHGLELRLPDGSTEQAPGLERFRPALARLQEAANERLGAIPGVLLERKPYSLAVHFRLVPEDEQPRVQSELAALQQAFPEFKSGHGKKVLEFLPALDWHKGRAVQWLIARLDPGAERTPVYCGDDITDEDAFKVLAGIGQGVFVGSAQRATWARVRVNDADEALELLAQLVRRLSASERG